MSVFLFDSAFERLKAKCIGSPFEGLGDIHAAALSLSCSLSCCHQQGTTKGEEDGVRGTYPYGCSVDEVEGGGFGCNAAAPVSLPTLPKLRSSNGEVQIPSIDTAAEDLFADDNGASPLSGPPPPPRHSFIASDSSLVVWCLSPSSSPSGTPTGISSPPQSHHHRQTDYDQQMVLSALASASREPNNNEKKNSSLVEEVKCTQAKGHADDFDGLGGLGN